MKQNKSDPFIPNSVPSIRDKMLDAIGIKSVEDIYASIPNEIRFGGALNLPSPIRSESRLRKHVEQILSKNRNAQDNINFLGAGCWQHYVPAVCDEIAQRGEFVTAYGGGQFGDHGKWQAVFEFQSLLGELIGMDVVSTPTYDWSAAANSALLMACRYTGRNEILVPETISADRLLQMYNFVRPVASIKKIKMVSNTGLMDTSDLRSKISSATASVYFENPTFLGAIETGAYEIVDIAKSKGALATVGVDPITLGVISPPSEYGADIVVGDIQPLGIHMYGGGGLGGFIASNDNPELIAEYNALLVSIAPGLRPGEFGFDYSTFDRTSYEKRGLSPDYIGTTQWLWAIIAGVYLSLMGPVGMNEVGKTIMERSSYASKKLGNIPGIKSPSLSNLFFKEFVVDFSDTGKTVEEINIDLLDRGVFGGFDLSSQFKCLGQSSLYCVTEVHTKDDIDFLTQSLKEILT
ncbi:MAG: glycine dehydrogenase subunit 1 [Chloroflexi bacterium]|jgi:glycine dehydrogenase subunit 1|nr:MAG: glycine dehydrogenase subunit 1 [Chloroflexota bacterium]